MYFYFNTIRYTINYYKLHSTVNETYLGVGDGEGCDDLLDFELLLEGRSVFSGEDPRKLLLVTRLSPSGTGAGGFFAFLGIFEVIFRQRGCVPRQTNNK